MALSTEGISTAPGITAAAAGSEAAEEAQSSEAAVGRPAKRSPCGCGGPPSASPGGSGGNAARPGGCDGNSASASTTSAVLPLEPPLGKSGFGRFSNESSSIFTTCASSSSFTTWASSSTFTTSNFSFGAGRCRIAGPGPRPFGRAGATAVAAPSTATFSSSSSSLISSFTACSTGFAMMTPGATCTLLDSSSLTAMTSPGALGVADAAFSAPFLAAASILFSIGDSPFSQSSLTINFTRSWAAFVPSTISVLLPPTAFEVSLRVSARAASSMAFKFFSIFCVMGPSGILIKICSAGPSFSLRFSLPSCEITKLSVKATHSPVATKVVAKYSAFFTTLSFPSILSVLPLSTQIAPEATLKSSKCLCTSFTSSSVDSTMVLDSAFFSFLSSWTCSSAPKPTRLRSPWKLRLTPCA
mmetsp:Transcript_73906/g.187441  ORF Transcript_73906/g.187441 Transcript_73906/m.187441 type:complete len:414 (+) Transcript_73906:151-1392(+)